MSSNEKIQIHFLKLVGEEATLTFESFALEGLCHNAGRFALNLLGLPESFAQLLHIVTIDYVRVPPTNQSTRLTEHNMLHKILTNKRERSCNDADRTW